jgi:hypothetical protein
VEEEQYRNNNTFQLPPFNLVATLEIERNTKVIQDLADTFKTLDDETLVAVLKDTILKQGEFEIDSSS